MSKKYLAAAAMLAVAPLVLSACGGSSNSSSGGSGNGGTIQIGTVHPLTGSNAGDGQQMENGVKLAIETINNAGGIKSMGGAKLGLAPGDTQGKPDIGQSEAQRLIQSGAKALVGTYQSAVSANVAAVAERNKTPFVMDITGDDTILEHGYKYSFRMQPKNSVFGASAAQYLHDVSAAANKPAKKVAYLHESTAFGTNVYKAFKVEAEKLGMTVDPEISYDAASVSNLTTQMTQVKASGADVLAITGYYKDGVLAAKAVSTVKPNLNAVIGAADGAFDQPQFPNDAGAAAQGYFDTNYHIDTKSADAKKFVDLYKSRYNDDPRTGAALAYDSVRVIADGLEHAGSSDGPKLRDAIAATKIQPLTLSKGPVQFSDTGENTSALPILTQVQGPSPVVVFPADSAQAKPIYPANPGQ